MENNKNNKGHSNGSKILRRDEIFFGFLLIILCYISFVGIDKIFENEIILSILQFEKNSLIYSSRSFNNEIAKFFSEYEEGSIYLLIKSLIFPLILFLIFACIDIFGLFVLLGIFILICSLFSIIPLFLIYIYITEWLVKKGILKRK